ncbi:MAG TPA: adenine deaminase [Tepidisphaeraceae bacterium]|nr:adenine deaminase [Tepidisphaeraceae bacterium]
MSEPHSSPAVTPHSVTPQLLSVARGDSPADLLLGNARIINVFSGEIESADIAISGGFITGVGSGYEAREVVDLRGAYVAPGLIDAHVHIESSLCLPAQFAAAIVPRGVTTVIADPHEIANVAGAAGVRFMADASRQLPLRVILMAPSCVPATDLATAGAKLTANDLRQLLDAGVVHGLAEVMNFPVVIHGEEEVLRKINAFNGRPVDGHAPGVSGKQLCAYIAAGIGSDHESVTVEEAREKLSRGMYVLIREATNARNLEALLAMITESNSRRICFCTDDRTPIDLLEQGSIDSMLRRAIQRGVDPITAIRCCTLNPAEWFQLHDRGAIAPGRVADFFVFDELARPTARAVYARGQLVAQDGRAMFEHPAVPLPPDAVRDSVRIQTNLIETNAKVRGSRIRVIGLRPDQLITDVIEHTNPMVRDGYVVSDPDRDVLKMLVIERHEATGRVGIGFVRGFGLKRGAIAGTFAHDHHNIIAIGCNDAPLLTAAFSIARWGGGLCVVDGMDELGPTLRLPIAGLMSDRPIKEVAEDYRKLLAAARELGSTLHDPFMAMSFMALEVIPSLKLTDRGLIDVDAMKVVDLFV